MGILNSRKNQSRNFLITQLTPRAAALVPRAEPCTSGEPGGLSRPVHGCGAFWVIKRNFPFVIPKRVKPLQLTAAIQWPAWIEVAVLQKMLKEAFSRPALFCSITSALVCNQLWRVLYFQSYVRVDTLVKAMFTLGHLEKSTLLALANHETHYPALARFAAEALAGSFFGFPFI